MKFVIYLRDTDPYIKVYPQDRQHRVRLSTVGETDTIRFGYISRSTFELRSHVLRTSSAAIWPLSQSGLSVSERKPDWARNRRDKRAWTGAFLEAVPVNWQQVATGIVRQSSPSHKLVEEDQLFLEPGRTVASSFATTVVALRSSARRPSKPRQKTGALTRPLVAQVPAFGV